MNEILKKLNRLLSLNKNHNIINILGLAIGIACVFIIMLWVEDELKFDTFNKNSANIYRVLTEEEGWSGYTNSAMTMRPLANALKANLPEVEKAASFEMDWDVLARVGENSYKENGLAVVSEDFFDMFSFPFAEGDSQAMFQDKYSVAISEQTAKKYFGEKDVLGKYFELNKKQVKVAAVFKDIDYNSHIRYDIAISTMLAKEVFGLDNSWDNWCLYTYIQTAKNTDPANLASKLYTFLSDYKLKESDDHFLMQPLTEIHLHKGLADEDYSTLGDKQYVFVFSFLGILILILACVNYINLNTAVSDKSIKQSSVLKVLGATRYQLIINSMVKSILISVIATAIAVGILYLVLPSINNLAQKNLVLTFSNPAYLAVLLFISLITGLVSGIIPAFYNSSFSPLNCKKDNKLGNINWQRKGLVTLQFSFSVILIIATLVSFKQLRYISNKNLGFDKEHTIHFYLDIDKSENHILKERLMNIPGIKNVASKNYFSTTTMNMSTVTWSGNPEEKLFVQNQVDENYFDLLNVNFIDGKNFSKDLLSENRGGVIINKTAKGVIGTDDPIGMNLDLWGGHYRVIGVIDDVHFWSLNENIHPEFYRYTESSNYFLVKFRDNPNISSKKIISQIRLVAKDMCPTQPFDYAFLNASYARLYDNDRRVGKIFAIMAGIAIFISCMGLFGLSLFSVERRIKEIGIRKVNGAKITEVLIMLSSEFITWIIVACVIAMPIAFFVTSKWLENFAFRTELSWWIFILAGLTSIVVALLTVSWQSWRAATRNPVEALRYE